MSNVNNLTTISDKPAVICENATATKAAPLTIDEALAAYAEVDAYLTHIAPLMQSAIDEKNALLAVISSFMKAGNAKKYVGATHYGQFVPAGKKNAKVIAPDNLRTRLMALGGILPSDLDAALPLVPRSPEVKPELRKVRELRDYGTPYADIIDDHIEEGGATVKLVVMPLVVDVPPKPTSTPPAPHVTP